YLKESWRFMVLEPGDGAYILAFGNETIIRLGLSDGWSLPDLRERERKVRSPQGGVPANGRGRASATESATENIPPDSGSVRVKWCGKSAPRREQSRRQGKPHAEQDQIGEEGRPVPLLLPGRSLEPGSNIRPRGMTTARKGTETGLQAGSPK